MKSIHFKKKDNTSRTPTLATDGSAGLDFYAHSWLTKYTKNNYELPSEHLQVHSKQIHIASKERLLVGTGIFMAIPKGYVLDIRPRSGKALKTGIAVLNSPGTIDSDYRGEIGIILINTSDSPVDIVLGEKIAQGVLLKYETPSMVLSKQLPKTNRGSRGFGSTGN